MTEPALARSVSSAGEPPCVVHLVRAANGLAPLERFVAGWRRHDPGTDFKLVVALKGFASAAAATPHLELIRELDPEPLFFADTGLDLSVYCEAAASLGRESYCFVNSFSEPLVDGWLGKLNAALRMPGVGLAGATGSWASMRSWMLYCLGAPGPYTGALPGRRVARRHLAALGREHDARLSAGHLGPARAPRGFELTRARLRALGQIPDQLLAYEAFPAEHVRTNAVMVAGATLARLDLPWVKTKRKAYGLESGRRNITRQVQQLGLRTVVVDRNGIDHDPGEWPRACTFWRGEQEGLLVADNQTRAYAAGDPERRRVLSGFAWGPRAQPSEVER